MKACNTLVMPRKYYLWIFLTTLVVLSSCSAKRNLTYFSDLPKEKAYETAIMNSIDTRIQPRDVLSITVSSLDPVTNSMFNTGMVEESVNDISGLGSELGRPPLSKEGYLVDRNGDVNFPVVGKINVGGKTLEEAQELIFQQVNVYVKDPIVSVRYLNFRITVIGEVSQPGTFAINNDQVTVLEALGLAGDMTVYGKRNNVLLIRQHEGKRTMYRLDLNKSEVFNSEFFYLHQNDVIYVEPSPDRDPSGEKSLRIVSTIATIAAALSIVLIRIF